MVVRFGPTDDAAADGDDLAPVTALPRATARPSSAGPERSAPAEVLSLAARRAGTAASTPVTESGDAESEPWRVRGSGREPVERVRTRMDQIMGRVPDEEADGGRLADRRPLLVEPASHEEPPEPEVDPADVEARLVRALARKGLSEAEVLAQAEGLGLDPEEANAIVERFLRAGYLSDEQLAEQLVLSLRDRKKQSRSVIARTLQQRGLRAEAVESALSELDADEETEIAREIAVKRAGQMSGVDAETLDRRLSAFLARRGYNGATVRAVVGPLVAARRGGGGVRFR